MALALGHKKDHTIRVKNLQTGQTIDVILREQNTAHTWGRFELQGDGNIRYTNIELKIGEHIEIAHGLKMGVSHNQREGQDLHVWYEGSRDVYDIKRLGPPKKQYGRYSRYPRYRR